MKQMWNCLRKQEKYRISGVNNFTNQTSMFPKFTNNPQNRKKKLFSATEMFLSGGVGSSDRIPVDKS
jgi:hypothetical protein